MPNAQHHIPEEHEKLDDEKLLWITTQMNDLCKTESHNMKELIARYTITQ